jgi:phenolic acid decarboxylase
MSDKATLLQNFVDAALALMKEGLSELSVEKAFHVDRAQKMGADVVLVFAPGAGTVVGALHFPDPAADTPELFRIVVPSPEGSTN